jgi:NAD(P)-dependent dehydrogenase (short-subunit alcohol dehydrogenase family)
MKSIVITGSTRGIGFGLAGSFLELGCAATVSGRSQASVDKAAAALSARHDAERVFGQPCDVTSFEQVGALWDAAVGHYGSVDVWINNAGLGNLYRPFWEQTPEQIDAIVRTNVLGVMYGTQVAFQGMVRQGFGQIYNMEGFGSNGRTRAGLTVYGSTKRGIRYFTRSLLGEVGDAPVQIGALSPGMVATDLLLDAFEDPAELERFKRVFNIIGDQVETVTPWLARQVLANERQGADIRWLTRSKLLARFLSAPFSKRDLFGGDTADG